MKFLQLTVLFILIAILPARADYFRTLGMADGLINYSVHSIYQDALGRMWFGTPEGISIYDGHKMNSFRMYDLIGRYPSNEIPVSSYIADS